MRNKLTSAYDSIGSDDETPALPRRARQILDALIRAGGVQNQAAKLLGITRQGVSAAVRRYPELSDACEAALEELKDDAESELAKAVRRGRAWAIKFLLDRKAKDRGYGASLGLDGELITNNVVIVHAVPKAGSDSEWERIAQAEERRLRKRDGLPLLNGAPDDDD